MKGKSRGSIVYIAIVLTILLMNAGVTPVQAASLSLDKTNYSPGEKITVRFNPSTGIERTAWIGVIPSAIAHGNGDLADEHDFSYFWLTTYPGGVGELLAPKDAGNYDVRYISKDPGGIELASVSFTVGNSPATSSISLTKTSFAPGEQIDVTFTPSTGLSNHAWIGIIPSAIAHGDGDLADEHDSDYEWVSTHPNGSMQLDAPQSAGSYDIRLFNTDPQGVELASVSFTVVSSDTAPPAQLTGSGVVILQIDNPSMQINGVARAIDSPATIVNGRTLVPLRAIFEALGASLQWNPAEQSITAIRGDQTLRLVLGSTEAYNNGSQVQLDTPPQIINGYTMVPLRFVGESLGEQVGWDANTRQVSIGSVITVGSASPQATSGLQLSPTQIHEVVLAAHEQVRQLISIDRLPLEDAVTKEIATLKSKPEVDLVEQLTDSFDLRIRFKDGYELVMLQSDGNTRGSTSLPTPLAQTGTFRGIDPETLLGTSPRLDLDRIDPGMYQPPTPYSCKALIFDSTADNPYQMAEMDNAAKNILTERGYGVTIWANDYASLANATLIDEYAYGLVLINSHGGILNGEYFFMVRPYYSTPPPANSGYKGTIVACVDNGHGHLRYVYMIGSKFAETYWTNRFPGTFFVVNACHSSNTEGLSSLPYRTLDNGASAWLGWTGSVLFKNADSGSLEFLNQLKQWKTLDEALVKANSLTDRRPPYLTLADTPGQNGNIQLPYYAFDADEAQCSNGQDLLALKMEKYDGELYARIFFWGSCASNEFYLYFDNNGDSKTDTALKCNTNTVAVYSFDSEGNATLLTSAIPRISGNNYSLVVPWDKVFGGTDISRFRIIEYSSSSVIADMLPDSGWMSQ